MALWNGYGDAFPIKKYYLLRKIQSFSPLAIQMLDLSKMIVNDERQRRKAVWIALSEFYLDTELVQEDFERIAGICMESGFSEKELTEINYFEVAPVVGLNLWAPVGNWAGFDQEWLTESIERITDRSTLYKRLVYRIRRSAYRMYMPFVNWATKRYWEKILTEVRKSARA